ncbi:fungal specific transcription factor [Hirsutella rhossiliensis]|uniref:Fungal specific transcription factor domain-containing protein n=1 Tax=Hirsutella rhossiliensis TaxID=111463 RepID=A0A9P8MR03_9HYPO|nr:fungal specific transcription factor domain-containing protein [Hirsutella rhossiliensis]KAH0958889.1 fungal specific transcription factor domain-containing protein [Hirsutella rhossiliensis]
MSSPPPSPSRETAVPSSRRKRFPYTQIACDECRRRKVKCSGERPCRGCRESDAACLFERHTRFRLSGRRPAEVVSGDSGASARTRRTTAAKRPRGHPNDGPDASARPPRPDSADYYLGLAGKILAASGPGRDDSRRLPGQAETIELQRLREMMEWHDAGAPGVVLLRILSEHQWARVLNAYEEEVGLQYPFLDLEALKREIQSAHQSDPNARRGLSHSDHQGLEGLRDCAHGNALMVATIVFTLADPNAAGVADSMVEEVHAAALIRSQLSGIEQHDLSVLILTSTYFFLSDRELLAWRGIGTVMRLLQELGHHRSCTWPSDTDPEGRARAERLFWTAYTLDRRLSFGLGLPFAIQDTDVDHDPVLADESASSAYLKHMVLYCRLASDVRRSALEASSAASEATRACLDFRTMEWRRNLPRGLRFGGPGDKLHLAAESRGRYRLRLTLHLRANQMRAVIHRTWAVRAGAAHLDLSTAGTMAEVSRDTIQILAGLADETDIYHAQHKTFNHYLQTALSSLLLALCSTENVDGASCLRDAQAGLELVRRLSTASPITQRLLGRLQQAQHILGRLAAREAGSPRSAHPIDQPMASQQPSAGCNSNDIEAVITAQDLPGSRSPRPAGTSAPGMSWTVDEAFAVPLTPLTWSGKPSAALDLASTMCSTSPDVHSPTRPSTQPAMHCSAMDQQQAGDCSMSLVNLPDLEELLEMYGDGFSF